MNEANLIPNGCRTPEERRENARKAGRASGEARRKKADFRRTLNQLLTTEIDSPEWAPLLESLGVEPSLGAALNMAMIKAGLQGDVKAYLAVAKYAGQMAETDYELKKQELEIQRLRAELDLARAKLAAMQPDEDAEVDDGFLDALNDMGAQDWADDETEENSI